MGIAGCDESVLAMNQNPNPKVRTGTMVHHDPPGDP